MVFDQDAAKVFFDQTVLDRSMKQADPQTVRLLLEMSERQLDEAEAETSLAGAVKALLVERIDAPPKLDQVAQHLGLSSRSLRRKLAESGTSYQKILDEIRLRMANTLIAQTTTPIATIAYGLGFANASDFARAYKKWTGQPPSSARRA